MILFKNNQQNQFLNNQILIKEIKSNYSNICFNASSLEYFFVEEAFSLPTSSLALLLDRPLDSASTKSSNS